MTADELVSQADSLKRRSLYSHSHRLYKKALKLINGINGRKINCLLSLSDTERMMGAFYSAYNHYKAAKEMAEALNDDKKIIADAMTGMALSKRAQGYHSEALNLIEKTAKIYSETNDKEGIAFTTWAAAGVYRVKGDIGKALEIFNCALEMYRYLNDQSGIGYSFCGLGGASRIKGRYDDSYTFYKEANAIFSSLDDYFGAAYSFCGIGNSHRMRNDYEQSEQFLKRALSIYRKIGDITSSAYTLWSLGMLYTLTNKLGIARKCYNKSASFFRKTGDIRGAAYYMLGVSQLDYMLGNEAACRLSIESAERLTKEFSFMAEHYYALHLKEALSGCSCDSFTACGIEKPLGASMPINIP
ncbi:hypothetical protein MCHI_003524 [Candidatus Magnetoovum chiemensis]|nr:hypothetical protein MCHI_003524 [Candidatus Magnetoovum chiemensis]